MHPQPLSIWLAEKAAEVRRLEGEAKDALHGRGDEKAYRGLMRDKAVLLASLAEEAEERMDGLSPRAAGSVRDRLARFSRSAATALDVDSVFFMSALLYPEDYQNGEPNDLERYIKSLDSES